MPEVWFFGGLLTLIFLLCWTFIEIVIKWLVLDNILFWESAWRSLVSSVILQLLQIPGAVLALILSYQILKSGTIVGGSPENTLLFLLVFVFFRFVTDIMVGGLFLTIVKKNTNLAWRASLVSSFIGTFFLTSLIMIINNSGGK